MLFLKDFIYLFLERGEGREKGRERNIKVWLPLTRLPLGTWPATQTYALTGNRTGDPLVPRPAHNPLSHTIQGNICFYYKLLPYCFSLLLQFVLDPVCPTQILTSGTPQVLAW